MAYHVNISGKGFSIKSSSSYNLTAEEVREKFVHPWEEGREIISGGKVFDPKDSEIKVMEGLPLEPDEERNLASWLLVIERCSDVTDEFIVMAPGAKSGTGASDIPSEWDQKRVAVIHGREAEAATALFDFLRALSLHPLEWTELVRATGSGAPSNRTVVQQLFSLAGVAVVLLTPDDEVRLHRDLVQPGDPRGEGEVTCQPRPNVFLEAGMALAYKPDQTIFVEIGVVRQVSDLEGINTVRLDGTAGGLHELAERLRTAGCDVQTTGSDWLEANRFGALKARIRLPQADTKGSTAGAE